MRREVCSSPGHANDPSLCYLGHECSAKAPLIVIVGGNILHDPRAGVVHFRRPAATTGHVDDLGQQLRVQTKAGEEWKGGNKSDRKGYHTLSLYFLSHTCTIQIGGCMGW